MIGEGRGCEVGMQTDTVLEEEKEEQAQEVIEAPQEIPQAEEAPQQTNKAIPEQIVEPKQEIEIPRSKAPGLRMPEIEGVDSDLY